MHMDKKEGTIWTILNNRMEQCLKWWNIWRVKKQDWLSGIVFDTRFHTDIWGPWEYRGKHRIQKPLPEVFCEKRFLKNSAKVTGKHLCQSLFFNKVAGLRPATLLKKRLWHRCFAVSFGKFLRRYFFMEHLWWLPLDIVRYNRTKKPKTCYSKICYMKWVGVFRGNRKLKDLGKAQRKVLQQTWLASQMMQETNAILITFNILFEINNEVKVYCN